MSFPNWVGDVGTDRLRIGLFDDAMAKAVNAQYGAYIDARAATGYVAPPLVGLWSSAPYLHNGTIPTLYHLMHPAERPVTFYAGGHRSDLNMSDRRRSRADAGAWLFPAGLSSLVGTALIDTRRQGLGQCLGHDQTLHWHERSDKTALLEYLKLF